MKWSVEIDIGTSSFRQILDGKNHQEIFEKIQRWHAGEDSHAAITRLILIAYPEKGYIPNA